jgi:2-polyprenyl-3-methyl-5-hydroxy-6-metoxy-1,4-benzoquinol methylase
LSQDAIADSILRSLRSHLSSQGSDEGQRDETDRKPKPEPANLSRREDPRELLAANDPARFRAEGSGLVPFCRRILLRLLYPVLRNQHDLVAVNMAAIEDLQRSVRDLERHARAAGSKPRRPLIDFKLYEDELRGDEQWLKGHQERYLHHFAGARGVLDVGCGRGEFLELLREANVPATGVDLDGGMIAHCRGKGLSVEQSDALDYLAGLDPSSTGGIFCAQLLEHLDAEDAITFIDLCARALQPGTALVIETPNPESLIVFSAFYQDLSHVRPYHPRSLIPLRRARGFRDVEVDYSLRPDPELWIPPLPPELAALTPALDESLQRLSALVYGPLAYALVARRAEGRPA